MPTAARPTRETRGQAGRPQSGPTTDNGTKEFNRIADASITLDARRWSARIDAATGRLLSQCDPSSQCHTRGKNPHWMDRTVCLCGPGREAGRRTRPGGNRGRRLVKEETPNREAAGTGRPLHTPWRSSARVGLRSPTNRAATTVWPRHAKRCKTVPNRAGRCSNVWLVDPLGIGDVGRVSLAQSQQSH
jgi:hypothetical protein